MKKVAIVGVEGSGKTVMLAGLGDLYTNPDAGGYFLSPKNYGTAAYVANKIARMRAGEWPSATAGDAMQGLDWTLKQATGARSRPTDICEVSFLDFAGEVYRHAFGIKSGSGDHELTDQVASLRSYIEESDELIVLINLRDVIVRGTDDERVQEAMWITNAILNFALEEREGRKVPRAAIVLSQADSYRDTIDACGGAVGVLRRHLPHVANNYGWLDVFAASAVDKTVMDAEGNVLPADDFTTEGLHPIVGWILNGLDEPTRRLSRPDVSSRAKTGSTQVHVPVDGEGSRPVAQEGTHWWHEDLFDATKGLVILACFLAGLLVVAKGCV